MVCALVVITIAHCINFAYIMYFIRCFEGDFKSPYSGQCPAIFPTNGRYVSDRFSPLPSSTSSQNTSRGMGLISSWWRVRVSS